MAFEIFNALPSWPQRIEALVRVLGAWGPANNETLAYLISPGVADVDRGMLLNCLDTAEKLGLILQKEEWQLTDVASQALAADTLRQLLQTRILAARARDDDHFGFCLFFSWVIAITGVQGKAHILTKDATAIAEEFVASVPSGDQERQVNTEKARAGLRWAQWLGLGMSCQLSGAGTRFLAYPRQLLLDFSHQQLPSKGGLPASEFATRLRTSFPLLDGGAVADLLPQEFRPHSDMGPALSEGLRLLQDEGRIELVEATDAPSALRLHHDSTRRDGAEIMEIRRAAS